MATSASPETEAASVTGQPADDFGYAAGAEDIHREFALRLLDARRRLPRHERPFAIRALREMRAKELEALRARCARRRRDWYRAAREMLARQRGPARPIATARPRPATPIPRR